MTKRGFSGFFEEFINKETLFQDKKVLQSTYTPETIRHRTKQMEQIANVLAPALKLEKPSNLFLYGKTGTGKTLSIKYISNEMKEIAQKREIPLAFCYLNCKLKRVADTEYRLIAQLARELGKSIPPTGLPTDEVYNLFLESVEHKNKILVLILDEIDHLVKKAGDEILYNLTRVNSELKTAQISLVGISNDFVFANTLDPRVKSSLSEEEILFPPYNALQIQDILKDRAKHAFKPNVLETGMIEKCAAYAAREHGDARRALELLRVAGELAEREGEKKVRIKHLDEAEEKIEKDRIQDVVATQPKQFQIILYAIMSLYSPRKEIIYTGDVYNLYKDICDRVNLRPLTQRRVSDVIAELDMHGIINAKTISKGRYGRTREISVAVPVSTNPGIKKILEKEIGL